MACIIDMDSNKKLKYWDRMDKFLKEKKLFCFTPEVMLATFLTEIALAIYVFIRYRLTAFGRLAGAILILLGAFQFAEYRVCADPSQLFWPRAGFAITTFLPVLGLHLISLVTKKSHFLKFGYVLMLTYVFIFLFAPKAISGAVCGGNYIIFNTAQNLAWTYSVYYFGFLLLGIWEAFENMTKANKDILIWIIVGYFSFMLPMGIVYSLSIESRQAIPSITCGFALILAFILAFKITPKYKQII